MGACLLAFDYNLLLRLAGRDVIPLAREKGVAYIADGIFQRGFTATTEWFYPCLERFARGVSSLAESYVIERVYFLLAQVAQLSAQY